MNTKVTSLVLESSRHKPAGGRGKIGGAIVPTLSSWPGRIEVLAIGLESDYKYTETQRTDGIIQIFADYKKN